MDDNWELLYGITDPNEDSDDDGISNAQEYREGTNPKEAAISLSIGSPADGSTYSTDDLISLVASINKSEWINDIEWHSDLDGPLGLGLVISTSLTLGAHEITASIPNADGESLAWPSIQLLLTAPGGTSTDIIEPTDQPEEQPAEVQLGVTGDLNGDERLSVVDLLLLEKHVILGEALTADQLLNADLYPASGGDGELTVQDLLLLHRRILELEEPTQ